MCTHENQIAQAGRYVCTDCGYESGEQVFVTSYDRAYTFRRITVYSRQKRFLTFVRSLKLLPLQENEDNILSLFGHLEFFFNMGHTFQRVYFFNRFCTLAFIATVLQLKISLKTLKDQARVKEQFSEMEQLLSMEIFPTL